MVGIVEDLKLVELRPMNEKDIPYIYSSWMEDYLSSHFIKTDKRSKQTHVALMFKELYFKEQRALIDKIIKRSKVIVACNADDTDQIFGYMVHRFMGSEIGIISYIYVRPVYRGMGICNKLMNHVGNMDVITHLSPQRKWILNKYNLIFNPYMEALHD